MSNIETIGDIQNAKTSELVAFYNENSDKPVKKFADRATAEARCVKLLESILSGEVEEEIYIPRAIVKSDALVDDAKPLYADDMTDAEFAAASAELKAIDSITTELEEAEKKKFNSISEGVTDSWKDPEVFKKRLTRNGVEVEFEGETQTFLSVRKAFAHYKLPDSKHIRFRIKLKQKGKLTFEWVNKHYHFTILESTSKDAQGLDFTPVDYSTGY